MALMLSDVARTMTKEATKFLEEDVSIPEKNRYHINYDLCDTYLDYFSFESFNSIFSILNKSSLKNSSKVICIPSQIR